LDTRHNHALRCNSVQLAACLERLSQLQTLAVWFAEELTTLAFLTAGSLPQTLTTLELSDFRKRPPVSDLAYVLQLRALRSLSLDCVFDAPLSEEDERQFRSPAPHPNMRQMCRFRHTWRELSKFL